MQQAGSYEKLVMYPKTKEEKITSIGCNWEYIESLKDEAKYNKVYISNITNLHIEYCGWRRVRGDGNCYYRSVIARYLLKTFHWNRDDNEINRFLTIVENLNLQQVERDFIDARQFIINYLRYALKNRNTFSGRINTFMNLNVLLQDQEFDLNLIRVSRLISYDAFMTKAEEYLAFIIEDERKPILKSIMRMGEEAEALQLIMLPLGLGINVRQCNLFDTLLVNNYPNEGNIDPIKIMISIICKMRGHYDMLYSVQEMEDECFNLKEGVYYYPRNGV